MISIYKTDKIVDTKKGATMYVDLRGLSTDTKPTELNGKAIGNGSSYIEIDTQKIFFYDLENEEWKGE